MGGLKPGAQSAAIIARTALIVARGTEARPKPLVSGRITGTIAVERMMRGWQLRL
jgi:hypothetical protein